jgi:hypothetical protein
LSPLPPQHFIDIVHGVPPSTKSKSLLLTGQSRVKLSDYVRNRRTNFYLLEVLATRIGNRRS